VKQCLTTGPEREKKTPSEVISYSKPSSSNWEGASANAADAVPCAPHSVSTQLVVVIAPSQVLINCCAISDTPVIACISPAITAAGVAPRIEKSSDLPLH
jgi:hypothetical protein